MIEKVPLFHRATYRLCQAYRYAPLIHNPNCDLIAGSKQAVPATKSCKVRGLDTGSCAESATGKNYCYFFLCGVRLVLDALIVPFLQLQYPNYSTKEGRFLDPHPLIFASLISFSPFVVS